MDLDYGRRYRELYERHWWWRAREAELARTLTRLRPAAGWGRALDVGCGDGLFFDRLHELGASEVEGVESEPGLVDPAGPHRAKIHVGPFDDSFRPRAPYSLVVMLDVLEHLDDPVAAMRHALTLMTPGATLIATVPAFMALWTTHDDLNHHVTRYTKASLGAQARAAGLAVVEWRYFFHWPAPAKLLGGLVERLTRPEPRPPAIPPAPINAALYWLTRAEQAVLGGLPVPFGSSLMMVGRKRS